MKYFCTENKEKKLLLHLNVTLKVDDKSNFYPNRGIIWISNHKSLLGKVEQLKLGSTYAEFS